MPEVLERHADLRLVLSGHLHRGFTRVREGICWSGAPSSCMQVDHPSHTHTAEPPAAHVLELGDDGSGWSAPSMAESAATSHAGLSPGFFSGSGDSLPRDEERLGEVPRS